MKKIILTLTLLILPIISAHAADISKLDIKGVQLGMSESDVKKNLSCNNLKKKKGWSGPNGVTYTCKTNESNTKTNIEVRLDHNHKVFSIEYVVYFDIKPNFGTLEKRIIKKYGDTNLKSSSTDTAEVTMKYRSLCWGDCKVYSQRGGYDYGVYKRTGLSLKFVDSDNYNEYKMKLVLSDGAAHKAYDRFEEDEGKKESNRKRNSATSISF